MSQELKLTDEQITVWELKGKAMTRSGRHVGSCFSAVCTMVAEALKRYPHTCTVRIAPRESTTEQLALLLEHAGFKIAIKDDVICGAVTCDSLGEELLFRLKAV